ncbi:MAG TPA: DUF4159 domain-containing protein, partial [Candidatus Methylacidiphilales bacterium]|nr:DUF4159 domain-containing protein [Candidatus Methylacidiphilales bacterium]
MAQAPAQAPPRQTPGQRPVSERQQAWYERLSRSRYFFGALFLHVIIFFLIATIVIFPAFKPPAEDFTKTYLPPSAPPPPPPPPQQTMTVPTQLAAPPTTTITSPNATASFSVPIPDITPTTTTVSTQQTTPQKIEAKPNQLSNERLSKIMLTEQKWGRDRNNILESNSDPHNVKATFPVYLASYADGDWGCNTYFKDGKISGGSLCNLVEKINQWSHGNITGEVVPDPLNIGGPDLLAKAPPFIFFTGHKDFHLTDQEVQNLRDYLQVGGMIWGDSALPGFGSRFDVAFHREMKRVVPDLDKNFEPVDMTSDIFTKSWYPIQKLASGMNYYAEPIQHLDIDGKLAILYTPNDYNDMFSMRILPGDTEYKRWGRKK